MDEDLVKLLHSNRCMETSFSFHGCNETVVVPVSDYNNVDITAAESTSIKATADIWCDLIKVKIM